MSPLSKFPAPQGSDASGLTGAVILGVTTASTRARRCIGLIPLNRKMEFSIQLSIHVNILCASGQPLAKISDWRICYTKFHGGGVYLTCLSLRESDRRSSASNSPTKTNTLSSLGRDQCLILVTDKDDLISKSSSGRV